MDWKKILCKYNKFSIEEQRFNKDEIEQAFEIMLDSQPTRKEFNECMAGLVFTADMIYLLWTREY